MGEWCRREIFEKLRELIKEKKIISKYRIHPIALIVANSPSGVIAQKNIVKY